MGILAVVTLVCVLFLRRAGVLAMVLAVGAVIAGIAVSWNDVELVLVQRAANAAFQQQRANTSAAVTVPSSTHARARS